MHDSCTACVQCISRNSEHKFSPDYLRGAAAISPRLNTPLEACSNTRRTAKTGARPDYTHRHIRKAAKSGAWPDQERSKEPCPSRMANRMRERATALEE
jgi:hypothetical protein